MAREAIEAARETLGDRLNVERPDSLFFVGSATEANALALEGQISGPSKRRRVLCSAIEHPSVIRTMEALAKRHDLDFQSIPVTAAGCIDLAAARTLIAPDVLICAVMLVNNEIGTIQPIQEIAALCRASGVSLHIDAVQGVGKLPIDVQELGADTLVLAGHKIGGLRGSALLYVRPGLQLNPLFLGASRSVVCVREQRTRYPSYRC
ncbi:MAG: aminotransferase class V-fold PLP-dependent enzyme [Elusimicrobiota bacterium]|nr:MAG: aminotransferase class V-fold PLP-dependent enzyme [Elusimicrobiota bacterium]